MSYHVEATIETVVVPTTANSAGGPCTADPGQVIVTFADGTEAVFPNLEVVDGIFTKVTKPKIVHEDKPKKHDDEPKAEKPTVKKK